MPNAIIDLLDDRQLAQSLMSVERLLSSSDWHWRDDESAELVSDNAEALAMYAELLSEARRRNWVLARLH
jgi:hypothetical protein